MSPAAAARQGLMDFDGAFLALMTVPDLVAGNAREETKTRPVPKRLTDRSGKTRKSRFRSGSICGTGTGGSTLSETDAAARKRVRTVMPAPHAGLDIGPVPSDN